MTTTAPIAYGELTNNCTCTIYNEETDTFTDSPDCFGDCYDDQLHFFGECVGHLFEQSTIFHVTDIQLWNGTVDNVFRATNVADLVHGMTVNSSWIMDYKVFHDRIEYSLAHHDAPTGSDSVVRPILQDE